MQNVCVNDLSAYRILPAELEYFISYCHQTNRQIKYPRGLHVVLHVTKILP